MGDGTTSRKEFSYLIITKVTPKCLEQVGKIFNKVFFPQIGRTSICVHIQASWLLEKLTMFVTYYATELKCNVRSVPAIMSALRHCMVARFVKCCKVFDDDLLKNVKHGISQLSAPAHRTRLPCTLDMINHIVNQNTIPTASMTQVMLATWWVLRE